MFTNHLFLSIGMCQGAICPMIYSQLVTVVFRDKSLIPPTIISSNYGKSKMLKNCSIARSAIQAREFIYFATGAKWRHPGVFFFVFYSFYEYLYVNFINFYTIYLCKAFIHFYKY